MATSSVNSNGGSSSNGHARLDDGKVRVAIIGVGNCANSLLQGRGMTGPSARRLR